MISRISIRADVERGHDIEVILVVGAASGDGGIDGH